MNVVRGKSTALWGTLAFAALAVSVSAATIRDDVPDSEYLALGALAAFTPVGTLVSGGFTGCGILIAPDWVLTAAHLVEFASSGAFTVNGTTYNSSAIYHDPGWTGDVYSGNDFGLVHLNTPVTGVTPATLYTGTSEAGQMATYVGYGFTGTGLTGWTTLDNNLRAFQDMLDGNFQNPTMLVGSDFDNPNNPGDNWWGSSVPLRLEGCVAPGDSGGGVFLQDGSSYVLAGVISFVAATDGSANSDYGDLSGAGRISAAMPWINSVVPEPSTYALTVGGGFIALCFHRRKKRSR